MQNEARTQGQGDLEQHDDVEGGPADRSSSRRAWDCAVGVAAFLTLDSVINVNRITPEHVVADAFDRLQTVVNKQKSTNRLGIMRFTNDNTIEHEDEEDFKPAPQMKEEAAVDIMVYELSKLNSMSADELIAEFRVFDPEAVGEIAAEDFRTALQRLGLSFSPEQFASLLSAIQSDGVQEEGARIINYVEFVDLSAEAIGMRQTSIPHCKSFVACSRHFVLV